MKSSLGSKFFFTVLITSIAALVLHGYFFPETPLEKFLYGEPHTEDITHVMDYDIRELQIPLKDNKPTVDLVILHSNEVKITWKEFQEEFKEAQRIFQNYGIQLNLLKAKQVKFPQRWNGLSVEFMGNKPEDGLDFYDQMNHQKTSLPERATSIFKAFLSSEENPSKTIYFITLSDITISWFEKSSSGKWEEVHSTTSALSFPSYLYGEDSTEIFAGKKGRWHRERLLLSPYLYSIKNGEKNWNKDYEKAGIYDDPIYKELIIKPACPKS